MRWVVPAVASSHGNLVITPTCANSVLAYRWPPPPQDPPVSSSLIALNCLLANSAPLGLPELPDVKQIHTGLSSSPSSGCGDPPVTLWF